MPWSPHAAIEFKIRAAPETVKTKQLRVHKRLPVSRDEKGKLTQWNISEQDRRHFHHEAEGEAEGHAQKIRSEEGEQADHVKKFDIEEEALELCKDCIQWSIAAERA